VGFSLLQSSNPQISLACSWLSAAAAAAAAAQINI